MNTDTILTINTGSSTIKAALYEAETSRDQPEPRRLDHVETSLRFDPGQSETKAAYAALFEWLGDRRPGIIGHRVVHGGQAYHAPTLLTDAVVEELTRLTPIDPTHMPQALAAIEATRDAFPRSFQVACFDTAFHRHMPRVARMFALPRPLQEHGIVRYGFHGLSCEFIVRQLQLSAPDEADRRVVIAHLGNGSSLTAVKNGVGQDTTMGFSPTGGLVMGTRAGDLDPGVLLYLLQTHSSPEALSVLLNNQSGLLGLSGISADMRELLNQESKDYRAREAIALYVYQARKFLGALVTVLGGLDTLVFTGGIGEHAAEIRRRICADLDFLGLALHPEQNDRGADVISMGGAPVTVRVIPTDEDLVIARHAHKLAAEERPQATSP